jgi:hypothetical protein
MTMGNTIVLGVAAALALGCGGSLSHDAGTPGQGGGTVITGGAGASGASGGGAASGVAGAGVSGTAGAGGASPVADAGSDQLSCVAVCGQVTGVPPEAVTNCRYPLRCSPPPGATGMVVFVNGQTVPQDLTEGWSYIDAPMSAFQLYGQACADASASGGLVDVDYLCEVALPAPPR